MLAVETLVFLCEHPTFVSVLPCFGWSERPVISFASPVRLPQLHALSQLPLAGLALREGLRHFVHWRIGRLQRGQDGALALGQASRRGAEHVWHRGDGNQENKVTNIVINCNMFFFGIMYRYYIILLYIYIYICVCN